MAIARASVLTGHVISSLIHTLASIAIVVGVALAIGFRPTASMPSGLRQFAEYQPFTPVTETLRGLLTGTPIGTNAIAATAWSVGIALAAYLWAKHLYNHRGAR